MYTTLITVTDAAPISPPIKTDCEKVTIGESPSVAGWPTVSWNYALGGGSQINKPAGTSKEFPAPGPRSLGSRFGRFKPNEKPITLQLPAGQGSSTFFWVEE